MNQDSQPTPLGEYLRAQRLEAGYSVRKLAALVGVDHGYLTRLESGERGKPSADVLQRIADALDIDAAPLLACIGVKPNMPAPRAYFRRAYGLSDAEATEAIKLLDERFGRKTQQDDK